MTTTVTIRPASKGRRAIIVNGEEWGYVSQQVHGSRGASYAFFQTGGYTVRVPHGAGTHTVSVPGDKLAQKHNRNAAAVAPLEDRLLAKAIELVADGHLRDPRVIWDEKQTRAREITEREQRRRADKKAAFGERAAACLPGGALPNEAENAATIAKIIEAMEWAQSQ